MASGSLTAPGSALRLLTAAALAAALLSGGMARGETPWVAPSAEKARRNPLPADSGSTERGAAVARANCAPCHGEGFRGDGPAAAALTPRPADWTSRRVQAQTEGELFWKVSTGRGAMPSWKHLPEPTRWAVVRFIKSLGP